ncbi:hypothetical protein [Psychrobacter sp. I-STPA6b]|nr:hypothetical protein [Psychrobacter sp. I-STPA6b]
MFVFAPQVLPHCKSLQHSSYFSDRFFSLSRLPRDASFMYLARL